MKRPEPPSLRETIRGLTEQLQAAGVESAEVDVAQLVEEPLDEAPHAA